MRFKDAKLPNDWITAVIRRETHGDLVEIDIQGVAADSIYLTKEDAAAFGRLLIELSESI